MMGWAGWPGWPVARLSHHTRELIRVDAVISPLAGVQGKAQNQPGVGHLGERSPRHPSPTGISWAHEDSRACLLLSENHARLTANPGSLAATIRVVSQSEERKKDNLQLQIERVSASPRCHLAHETDGEEALREPVMTRR